MHNERFGAMALLVGLALGMVSVSSAAAQDVVGVEIRTVDLGNGVYALFARGGNMGLSVGDDGVYVIDDQYAPLSARLLETISGLSDGPIRYVLNTHWHGDHTGGNEAFGETGAALVSHENVRARMETGLAEAAFGRSIEPAAEAALPDITLSQGATFHFNDLEVQVIHVPSAHTDGDSIVVFEGANVIHMGDVFFNGFYPFIDVRSGGSLSGNIAGLELGISLANADTRIIPGHGPMGDLADLQAARDTLVTVRARVSELISEGKAEDEAVAADPLADLDEEWGDFFITSEMMVRTAYQSLTQ